jgi:hypothetical protein
MRLWGTVGPSKGLGASGTKGLEPNHHSLLIHIFQRMCSMSAKDLSLSEDFTEVLGDGVTARRSDVKWAFGKKDAGL